MFDTGPDLKNFPASQADLKKDSSERRLYFVAVGFATLATGVVTTFILLAPGANSNSTVALHLWLQVATALLVLAFVVVGDQLTIKRGLTSRNWLFGAGSVALIVLVASVFAGEYLTVLLAPLVVGLAQRHREQQTLLLVALAAITLILLEHLLLTVLGWNTAINSSEQGPVAAIIVISTISLALAALMRNYRLEINSYQKEQRSNASEMEVAHEIQTALMPPSEIRTGAWSMFAKSIPARDVGGDFYEYIPHLDQGIGGVAIGDVAGKGIPAALQMAVVRTLFRVEARRRIFPAETLMSVNAALQAERSFGMVTLLYGFVDQTSSTLHLSNAGHNYPIILNGTFNEVRMPGLPLGIDDGIEYEEKRVHIEPGTSIIFYTDGVIEAMDTAGDLFGFPRLREAVLKYQQLEPRDMVDQILADVAVFTDDAPQSDDITIVVIQYDKQADGQPPSNAGVSSPLQASVGNYGEGNWI